MWYFFRTVGMAVKALKRNIMRSVLTTLGIIIGVAAVITVVEAGQANSRAVAEKIEDLGANMLLIFPGASNVGGVSSGSGSAVTLTPEDAEAIADPERCPSVMWTAPIVRVRTQVIGNGRNWAPGYLYGTTPEFLDIRRWNNLDKGVPFTDADNMSMREVCLIGQTVARELYGEDNPVGEQLRIQNKAFTILGVLSRKGANTLGMDQDDIVLAPWRTIKFKVAGSSATTTNQSASNASSDPTQQVNSLSTTYPTQQTTGLSYPAVGLYPTPVATQQADQPQTSRFINLDQIHVQARSAEDVHPAMEQIADLLRDRHHLRRSQLDDFVIRDMTESSKVMTASATLMAVGLTLVALISLLVGGVGIMNIMLVSVTERTREIGLRMAVGARSRDILTQFLVESAVLCLVGGVIGIIVGRTGSTLVGYFLEWPIQMSVLAIGGALCVSLFVGVVFGFYPAWKASRLDPIDALRYE
jgi:ABC-type antimicrobial peptide transport system permease subunit